MLTPSNYLESYIKELKKVFYLTSSMQKSVMHRSIDLKPILNTVLKECIAITNATSGSIMFKHLQSDRLFFYAEQGLDQAIIDSTRIHIGDGIAGTVIEEGVPKIINDIMLDPKYISINSKVRSEMGVPITVRGNVLGVIILDHTNTNAFTEKHLELIQMVCSHTGFIISHHIETLLAEKNSRLLENMINTTSITSAEDIFRILTKELNAHSACILNMEGEVFFQEGQMIEDIKINPTLFTEVQIQILKTENDQKIPYTRIIIPNTQKNLTFVADKIYYFAENAQTDLDFADKILEFSVAKNAIFHQDETLSQWAERKMSAPAGQVYDLAISSVEKEIIAVALKKNKDNRLKTALFLGINRNTLRHKMEIYGLEK